MKKNKFLDSKVVKFFISLEKQQKIFISIIIALLFIDSIIIIVRNCSTKYSSAIFSIENTNMTKQKLIALNSNAEKSKISNGKYAFFKFTNEQQKKLEDFYDENKSVNISITVALKSVSEKKYNQIMEVESPFYYGFLTLDDFDKKNHFIGDITKRVLSGSDLRNFLKKKNDFSYFYFKNGFSIEKNIKESKLPVGLLVYSSLPIEIKNVEIEKARIGFDYTNDVPFYGIPSNGGAFGSSVAFDFSGCSTVFPVQNSIDFTMPKIEISFSEKAAFGTAENPAILKINMGGEILDVYYSHFVDSLSIQTSTLNFPFSRYEISSEDGVLGKLIMTGNDSSFNSNAKGKVLKPLSTDPGLLLGSKKSNWRTSDYELYCWDRFPNILFFDTKNYKIQADFFRRIAFFVEKDGFKGRILSDEELGEMHGYNAHDYSAESLANFFNAIEKSNVQMNQKESLLRDILISNKIIINNSDEYVAGSGAIISVSQESASWLRRSLTAHEIWHGLFFTNEDFRNTTAAIYYTIDQKSLDFLHGFWKSQPGLGYDINDTYLMHNEFMAYILQQPLDSVAKYFIHVANRGSVMNAIPELCDYVKSSNGETFEDACKIFESYIFDKWGLSSGRVSLIVR